MSPPIGLGWIIFSAILGFMSAIIFQALDWGFWQGLSTTIVVFLVIYGLTNTLLDRIKGRKR